ncbi:MAG: hypothetical protein OXC30_02900 [Alphaproteobacteria bacterium]|nr:hypothetical protein [Alphaproteobacteria bacterium]
MDLTKTNAVQLEKEVWDQVNKDAQFVQTTQVRDLEMLKNLLALQKIEGSPREAKEDRRLLRGACLLYSFIPKRSGIKGDVGMAEAVNYWEECIAQKHLDQLHHWEDFSYRKDVDKMLEMAEIKKSEVIIAFEVLGRALHSVNRARKKMASPRSGR